jgi:hypothetical protein
LISLSSQLRSWTRDQLLRSATREAAHRGMAENRTQQREKSRSKGE